MSYLRLLDEARVHLDRADLLAAEESLERAREAWSASRVRAPLVEKGIEPALRAFGRLLGRRSEGPVLPVFSDRAGRLVEDLGAAARLLEKEAMAIASKDSAECGESERRTLQSALRLQRHSSYFALSQDDEWVVSRSYLDACRRLAQTARAELLPGSTLPDEYARWFEKWIESWLAVADSDAVDLAAWLRRQADALARASFDEVSGRWHWLSVRLSLLDLTAASAALHSVSAALTAGLDEQRRAQALVTLAELLTNTYRIASSGADAESLLQQFAADASELGLVWPPVAVGDVLRQRRPDLEAMSFVSVAVDRAAGNIVFVLHTQDRPCDVLFVQLDESGNAVEQWQATLPEIRGWLSRWAPRRSMFLCADEPDEMLRLLLAAHPVIAIAPLLRDVPVRGRQHEAAPPACPHPAWSGGGYDPWVSLVDDARSLVPQLRSLLEDSPVFWSDWGRRNLRNLGDHGVQLCGVLADAAELFGEAITTEFPLQTLESLVRLEWPKLADRPWISRENLVESRSRSVVSDEKGLWIEKVASPGELSEWATRHEFVEVLTHSVARALEIADSALEDTDPRRVTVAPRQPDCVEPWLRALEDLISKSVADPTRSRDVLWLLRALGESADGTISSALVHGGTEDGRRQLAAIAELAALGCEQHACRLSESDGCLSQQFEERRAAGGLWIVPVANSRISLDDGAVVVADDLREWVVGVDDSRAMRRLQHGVQRLRSASLLRVYTPTMGLGSALQSALHEALGEGRSLRRHESKQEIPAVWIVPPGYALGASLLAEEAEQLIRLRQKVFERQHPDSKEWSFAQEVEAIPQATTVHCARLADNETDDRFLLLLRLAAAASQASDRAVCLDPRVAELLSHPGGLWSGVDEFEVGSAFASGVALFAERANAPSAWAVPLSVSRLAAVGLERSQSLSKVLKGFGRGQTLVLGGLTEDERDGLLEIVQRLATESRDGGPLRVRCVITVCEPEENDTSTAQSARLGPHDVGELETAFLDIERGAITRLEIARSLLAETSLLEWSRRNGSVLWVFRHAEEVFTSQRTDAAIRDALALVESIERSGSACLAFCDESDDLPHSMLSQLAVTLHCNKQSIPLGERGRGWSLAPVRLRVGEMPCWGCGQVADLEEDCGVCPSCGRGLDAGPTERRAIALEFEERVVSLLKREGPQARWRLLVFDSQQRMRLEQRLGVRRFTRDVAPLLADGPGGEASNSVVLLDDLWRRGLDPLPIFVLGLCEDVSTLRAIFLRAQALGWPPSEIKILLPVPGQQHSVRLPAGPYAWQVSRAQVVQSATNALRELDAAEHDQRATAIGPKRNAVDARLDPRDWSEQFLVELMEAPAKPKETVQLALGALEAAGLKFEASEPAWLDVSLLQSMPARPGPFELLDWACAAELLTSRNGRPLAAKDAVAPTALERQLNASTSRSIAYEALDLAKSTHATANKSASTESVSMLWGIAGHGRSRWLCDLATERAEAGERVLVLVPGETQEFAWGLKANHRFDVCALSALGLSFLCRGDSMMRDPSLQILPRGGRGKADELRRTLMREISRRYAANAGHVPSVDGRELASVLEGEMPASVAANPDVDHELLQRVAAQTRRDGGWVQDKELWAIVRRQLESGPVAALEWQSCFDAVLVDDIHAMDPIAIEFLEELFGEKVVAKTGDPLFLDPVERGPVASAALVSQRLGKEILGAIEECWREDVPLPGRLKSNRRNRTRSAVDRARVLGLEAAKSEILLRIESELPAGSVAILLPEESDRQWMLAALRAQGIPAQRGSMMMNIASAGVRELLAAMCLVFGPGESTVEMRESWVRLLLNCGPDPKQVESALDYLGRLEARLSGEDIELVDSSQAHLARLVGAGPLPAEDVSVETLAQMIIRTGILERILALDTTRARLHAFLDRVGCDSAAEYLASIEASILVDPLASTHGPWIFDPADAMGLEFDHVIHLCSGYEGPLRHYAALSRALQTVTVLYSERDPLGGHS